MELDQVCQSSLALNLHTVHYTDCVVNDFNNKWHDCYRCKKYQLCKFKCDSPHLQVECEQNQSYQQIHTYPVAD